MNTKGTSTKLRNSGSDLTTSSINKAPSTDSEKKKTGPSTEETQNSESPNEQQESTKEAGRDTISSINAATERLISNSPLLESNKSSISSKATQGMTQF
jgi:hypothetical protein